MAGVAARFRKSRPTSRWKVSPDACLRELAERQRIIDFRQLRGGSVAGGLEVSLSGFILYRSTLDSPARQRFTLAHEIGHTLFYDLSCSPPQRLNEREPHHAAKSEGERRCDVFAAALLVPPLELRAVVAAYANLGLLQLARAVARHFNVTVRTAITRIMETRAVGLIAHTSDQLLLCLERSSLDGETAPSPGILATGSGDMAITAGLYERSLVRLPESAADLGLTVDLNALISTADVRSHEDIQFWAKTSRRGAFQAHIFSRVPVTYRRTSTSSVLVLIQLPVKLTPSRRSRSPSRKKPPGATVLLESQQ